MYNRYVGDRKLEAVHRGSCIFPYGRRDLSHVVYHLLFRLALHVEF
jgi:hypothetical protein